MLPGLGTGGVPARGGRAAPGRDRRKTVRRFVRPRKKGRRPLHLVSAYATEGGLVLAQRAAEGKGASWRSSPTCWTA
jgi:hypothetical protein